MIGLLWARAYNSSYLVGLGQNAYGIGQVECFRPDLNSAVGARGELRLVLLQDMETPA